MAYNEKNTTASLYSGIFCIRTVYINKFVKTYHHGVYL